MKKFTLTVFCILAGCIFFLSGIWVYFQKSMDKVDLGEGEYAASYQKHYLMISNDKDTLMWQSIYQSASETAKEADAYVELLSPEQMKNYTQEDCLRIGIASHVDGIILEADGSKAEQKLIEEAAREGIPVVTILTDDSACRRISFVGLNSYEMGSAYTDQIAGMLNEKGTTQILFLSTSSSKTQETNLVCRIRPMRELERSYREALRALNGSKSRVIHIEDLSQNGVYDEEFPVDMEKRIFRYLGDGDEKKCVQELNTFFDWMLEHYAEDMNNIRLKVLEYIIWGEKIAFEAGAVNYGFSYRRDYLDVAMACSGYEELRSWFLDKMVNICRSIRDQKEEQSNSAVKKAMLYIQENFSKDISLDEVSGQVNISPYYFSKIFKEETGENFIEYLTRTRIEKAKEFLKQPEVSVKEAGVKSGYTDPNYFSRIFKKQTDMTPSEFKTRYGK